MATPWRAYKDNHSGLFQTGHTMTNSLALTGNSSTGNMRISLTHSKSEWILPNSGYQRLTAAFAGSQQISKRVKINARMSYTYRAVENTPQLTYNSNSLSYFLIFMNPNFNLDWFKPMWYKGKENIKQIRPFSSYLPNPYVLLYEATLQRNTVSMVIFLLILPSTVFWICSYAPASRLLPSSRSSTDLGMTSLSLQVSSRSRTSLTTR